MSREERLDKLEEQMKAAGYTNKDIVYGTTLATLVRQKGKKRVLSSASTKWYDYDKIRDTRRPTPYGTTLDPENPPPVPYQCDPDCATCFDHTFPVRIGVTDEVTHARLAALSTKINENLNHLRASLQAHGDYIVTKWRKSKARRAEVLSAVSVPEEKIDLHEPWPDCVSVFSEKWAAVHLIDDHSRSGPTSSDATSLWKGTEHADDPRMAAMTMLVDHALEAMGLEDEKCKYRTTWLLPYLDVESLVEEPLLFLGLLHARTAHTPEEWMMFDNSQLKLAEHWEILIAEFNPHYVTMTGTQYGMQLVAWSKEESHRWKIVGYQKAIYILTAQNHMMRFLRSIVDTLIGDRSSEQSAAHHPKWDQLTANGFFSFGDSTSFRIRASANQPFLAPPTFDPIQTFELVESMYQACADDLDLAQTSPPFVQCLIRTFKNSLYSATWGKEDDWPFLVDEIMCNFYRRFIWWRQMHKECELMVQSYRRYIEHPTTKSRLEYEAGVFALHDIAIEFFAQQNCLVQYSLPFEKGFERNFGYEKGLNKANELKMFVGDEDAFHTDKLFWSVRALGFDRDRDFTLDPSFNFRVLDDTLRRSSAKERGRLSEKMLQSLSEMAVLEEIRMAIEVDRSWDRSPDKDTFKQPKFRTQFVSKYAQSLSLPEVIRKGDLASHLKKLCKGSPWPSGKLDDRWLAGAAASRSNLSKFWSEFRITLRGSQIRHAFPADFIEQDQAALSAAHRPSHVSTVRREEEALLERIKARAHPQTALHPSSGVQTEWWEADSSKFVAPAAKHKKKTRPSQGENGSSESNAVTRASAPAEHARTAEQPDRPRLQVKPENLKLFDEMFATAKAQMRSFSWTHFTQAMADAGCSVTQGSGSAVHFRSPQGVIVFHRPHPEPNIAQEIFIAMGKRLTKRFGWDEKTFCGVSSSD